MNTRLFTLVARLHKTDRLRPKAIAQICLVSVIMLCNACFGVMLSDETKLVS